MKVTFRRIYNDHTRLRDEAITGDTIAWPAIGWSFYLYAPPRDGGDVRLVNTSMVTKILYERHKFIVFETESGSLYSVEIV